MKTIYVSSAMNELTVREGWKNVRRSCGTLRTRILEGAIIGDLRYHTHIFWMDLSYSCILGGPIIPVSCFGWAYYNHVFWVDLSYHIFWVGLSYQYILGGPIILM